MWIAGECVYALHRGDGSEDDVRMGRVGALLVAEDLMIRRKRAEGGDE
jgi:hypothetical protein